MKETHGENENGMQKRGACEQRGDEKVQIRTRREIKRKSRQGHTREGGGNTRQQKDVVMNREENNKYMQE